MRGGNGDLDDYVYGRKGINNMDNSRHDGLNGMRHTDSREHAYRYNTNEKG